MFLSGGFAKCTLVKFCHIVAAACHRAVVLHSKHQVDFLIYIIGRHLIRARIGKFQIGIQI
jgi:hypothetical protein